MFNKIIKFLFIFVTTITIFCNGSQIAHAYEITNTNATAIIMFFKLHNVSISENDISEATQTPIDGDYEYGVMLRILSTKELNDIIMRVEQQSLHNLPVNTIVNMDGVFYILRDATKDEITFWNPESNDIVKMPFDDANTKYHKYGEAFMFLPRGYVRTF